MGRTHAVMGAALWLAAAPSLAERLGQDLSGGSLTLSTFVAAGAALLPDLDHPQATLARTLGPVTKHLAQGVGKLAGGHRKGTHCLLACFGIGALTGLLHAKTGTVGMLVILFVLAYVAMLALGLVVRRGRTAGDVILVLQAGLITGAAIPVGGGDWWWMTWAVGGGTLIHVLGDMCTLGGVPLFLPFSRRRFAVPLLGRTGSVPESVVCATMFAIFGVWVACATAAGGTWWTLTWLI